MDPISATTTVIGVADIITNRLSACRVRLERYQSHPTHFEILVHTHDCISNKLKLLRTLLPSTPQPDIQSDLRLVETHVNLACSALDALTKHLDKSPALMSPAQQQAQECNLLSKTKSETNNAFSTLVHKARVFGRTTRIDEALLSVRNDLESAWRVLNDIRLYQIERGVNAISAANLEPHESHLDDKPDSQKLDLDVHCMAEYTNTEKDVGDSNRRFTVSATSNIAVEADSKTEESLSNCSSLARWMPLCALILALILLIARITELAKPKQASSPKPTVQKSFLIYSTFSFRYNVVTFWRDSSVWFEPETVGDKKAFRIVPGLARKGISFESVDKPNHFLRHYGYDLWLHGNNGSDQFSLDATFLRLPGLANTSATSFESFNFKFHFIRHQSSRLKVSRLIPEELFKRDATWNIQEQFVQQA
eukprot:TRINITY_DN63276_c0_g1_i1.p1 TRINITY_DN63276_c0_g1~~TRINITY_DN63276_c0_g1_i1.p1  ORF type:complete len:423 (+),score=42.23 TRINITY_DN63276_c0_g1_i1:86-1354(+)